VAVGRAQGVEERARGRRSIERASERCIVAVGVAERKRERHREKNLLPLLLAAIERKRLST
jgi:hypothetical protein